MALSYCCRLLLALWIAAFPVLCLAQDAAKPATEVAPLSVPTTAPAQEIRHYTAPEARQGVAVDDRYFYAIVNTVIAKYDKKTGAKLAEWRGERGGPISHLNGGIVIEGKLYCAHSNFPELPMISSIEIFDTATLKHLESRSLGIYEGSFTWIDFYDNSWWLCFAHYNERGGTPGKDNAYTTLVRLDKNWQRQNGWVFPKELIARWHGMSASGGTWGPDGLLYTTGHDEKELYVLRLPQLGSRLEMVKVIPFPGEGQGFAFDRSQKGVVFAISRRNGEVISCKLPGF